MPGDQYRQLTADKGRLQLHQSPGLGFGFDEAAVQRYGGGDFVWNVVR